VIPCLNEQAAIESLVVAVRRRLPAVIVVDDGSTDATAALAKQAGAEVLRHEPSRGKGAALQVGWRRARERGFQWALTLDGDGQHSPEDVPAFLQCADEKSAALVVGNRMVAEGASHFLSAFRGGRSVSPHPGPLPKGEGVASAALRGRPAGKMPWLRRFVNRWMSRRLSNLTGRSLPDSQCGFRLMNLDLWSALPITAAHFEIESELLLAFLAAGHAVEFVPIRLIYKSEQSKIHPLRDTLRWIRWWSQARRRFRKVGTTKTTRG
jgi:glycosyltransferase involved in cell wall biosynthesis